MYTPALGCPSSAPLPTSVLHTQTGRARPWVWGHSEGEVDASRVSKGEARTAWPLHSILFLTGHAQNSVLVVITLGQPQVETTQISITASPYRGILLSRAEDGGMEATTWVNLENAEEARPPRATPCVSLRVWSAQDRPIQRQRADEGGGGGPALGQTHLISEQAEVTAGSIMHVQKPLN